MARWNAEYWTVTKKRRKKSFWNFKFFKNNLRRTHIFMSIDVYLSLPMRIKLNIYWNIGNACWSLKTVNYPTKKLWRGLQQTSFQFGKFHNSHSTQILNIFSFLSFFIEFVIAQACQELSRFFSFQALILKSNQFS